MRRKYASFPLVLALLLTTWQTPGRAEDTASATVATAIPIIRVTTSNPREINLGKPATFVISVANEGKTPATGVIVAAAIPQHVEVARSEPKPISVEDRIYKFQIGDLPPGITQRVILVAVPSKVDPIKLDATVIFGTSTRASTIVRRPQLQVAAQVSPQAVIGTPVEWLVRVTNTGDGRAENVVVTPSLLEGNVQGSPLSAPVQVGLLKPGETKEVQYTVVPTLRGKLSAKFVGSNPDGLEASADSTFQVLQPLLAVKAEGPQVQPLAREGAYEIQVTNPGDAPTGSTLVTVKVPTGLVITAAPENSYHQESRTLRWRITAVRPSDVVRLPFRAETTIAGEQTFDVTARADRVEPVSVEHTTAVLSRSNLIVTVMNRQELSAVGEPIEFRVTLLNAGSKPAQDLRVRVAVPEKLEAVDSQEYQVQNGQIEFPAQQLASGEKVTLAFQAIGQEIGEHRVRVLIDGVDFSKELSYEGAAFCYSETVPAERTTQTESRRRTAASANLRDSIR